MEEVGEARLKQAVRGVLEQARLAVGVPAICAAISSGGLRVVASTGTADLGRSWPVLETSRFGIACITKLLLAIVVSKLADEGTIDLDAPVDRWLEELHAGGGSPRGISLRHLLSHTAGYQGPLMFGQSHRKFSWQPFTQELSQSKQVFRPGDVFNYENTGHVLVGEVVIRITGREISDLIQEMIFAPLNISPGGPLTDYKNPERYVAPHQVSGGNARVLAPSPFGPFWKASLADITLTLDDLLVIGEAVLGRRKEVDFSCVRAALAERVIALPHCVSGTSREHAPQFFNTICAEYSSGWFGYAGSALGQTCALRFNLDTGTVCAVAMNSWLPIARDALLDQLCNVRTHADAGGPGGNSGFALSDLAGDYVGGGNIIRSLNVAVSGRTLCCTLGADGLQAAPLNIAIDENGNLLPDPASLVPGLGFFPDPATGAPCIMVGIASLKRVA